MSRDQDIALLQRIYQGDEDAYGEVFEMYFPGLKRFATSLVHSCEQGEEIASDVMISLWRNRLNIQSILNLRVYLMTAIRNRSLNWLKSVSGRKFVSLDDVDVNLSLRLQDPEQIYISNEMRRKVEIAVQTLPPRCKLVFKLIREEGLSYQEVAAILDISVKTVDAQLVTALKKITTSVRILYRNH